MGVSISALVRRAVEEFCKKHGLDKVAHRAECCNTRPMLNRKRRVVLMQSASHSIVSPLSLKVVFASIRPLSVLSLALYVVLSLGRLAQ